MKIEFYPISYKPFVREISLPLPAVFRIPKIKGGGFACSLDAPEWPPKTPQYNYIEFELGIIKYPDIPGTNVFNLPRKAYKEVQSVGRANENE